MSSSSRQPRVLDDREMDPVIKLIRNLAVAWIILFAVCAIGSAVVIGLQ